MIPISSLVITMVILNHVIVRLSEICNILFILVFQIRVLSNHMCWGFTMLTNFSNYLFFCPSF